MFKIITLGLLLFLLYRFIFKPGTAGKDPPPVDRPDSSRKKQPQLSDEEGEYIDYEDVE